MEIADLTSTGMDPHEARKKVLREFGNVECLKEECRDTWGIWFLNTLIRDIRFAFRQMARQKLFTFAVIATLAIGIGINSSVFSLVHTILYKPFPVPNGERLVVISSQNLASGSRLAGVSYPDFLEFKEGNQSFESIQAFERTRVILTEAGIPAERLRMGLISPEMFDMLSVSTVVGRNFARGEDSLDSANVAIISYRLWTNRYNENIDTIGRRIQINGNLATIVGVMPEGFHFSNNEEIWMPLKPQSQRLDRQNREQILYGILKRGISKERANADLATIALRQESNYPDTNKNIGVVVQTFHENANGGPVRHAFMVMLVAVGLVLLISCANVSNLFLGRSISRSYELTMRAAMGASRSRIIRQLLTECVMLSCIGGMMGLSIAWLGINAFDKATQDVGKPYWVLFEMDFTSFVYVTAISILSGLIFGLMPALRSSRINLNASIKDGARSSTNRAGGKLMGILVIAQFTFTFLLLTVAGLLLKGYHENRSLNPFVPENEILTANLSIPMESNARYTENSSLTRLYDRLTERMSEIHGVSHAAVVSNIPGGGYSRGRIEVEGHELEESRRAPRTSYIIQSQEGLKAINLPILDDSRIEEFERKENPEPVAIATRRFAAKHWPNQSPIGKRFRLLYNNASKTGPWHTVVGVTGDIDQSIGNSNPMPPLFFIPHHQEPRRTMILLLRTRIAPLSLSKELREAVQDVDSDLALYEVSDVETRLGRGTWVLRIFGKAFTIFAVAGLIMASIGLYAVVVQTNTRRTKEIGIRMALGATSKGILKFALKRGTSQLAIGLTIGIAGAFAATNILQGVLPSSVSTRDPWVFGFVFTLLAAIGMLACWLPAQRAASLKPATVIQQN